ncbi:transposase [Streptomyces sp. AK02-04a]|uniref:transposase n=1 Tax=Streptomyces sp. AK02-04a TaxID=3028649 RepID=UPI0029B9D147|nr:transposase [Streptomyces sp. AK02-04a]MDX3763314.1 transposase [Streptomyces sp. AK02-04a]
MKGRAGYTTPAHIERAARVHGITLLGPVVPDHSRQAKAGSGFAKSAFPVDWDDQQATCPQGAVSREWRPLRIGGHDYIQVKFAKADCQACPVRPQCTAFATRPRALALLPTRELHEIQTHNRLDQTTEEWQRRYAIRAGIEATLSQNIRTHGLRRSRYRGLKKTHVQHVLTALACNIARVADWLDAEPRTRRRATRFRTLCSAAA